MSDCVKRGTGVRGYPPERKKANLGYPKKLWSCVYIQSRSTREAETIAPTRGYGVPRYPPMPRQNPNTHGEYRETHREKRRLKWTTTKAKQNL